MKKILVRHKFHHLKDKVFSTCRAACTKAKKAAMVLSVSVTATLMMAMPVSAATGSSGTDIWSWLDTALNDLYQKFLGVSTIAACVAASVCLIMMNFSTDDRAVSTSRAWLKRILVSWVILNVLGFIMNYMISLTQGGSYVP